MLNLRKFLFENEAVIGIRSPSDYDYIKILRSTLVFISSWPRKEIGEYESETKALILQYFYLSVTIFCMNGIGYVIVHRKTLTFLEVGHMYIVILMNGVEMSRVTTLTLSKRYREVARDFLTKIHLFYYKDSSEFAMKTHKQIHLISHLFTLAIVVQMIAGLSLFNLIPMYNNYAAGRYVSGGPKNSSFEHSLYYIYPFNTSTDVKGYIVACLLHWFISYFCSILFCMFDLFLCLMVFNIWGHFKILINNLDNFPKPSSQLKYTLENSHVISSEMYSQDELLQISKRLNECIKYHREIVNFTDRMSTVFGPMLFVYYIFHQVCGCLLLLECSQMTAQALIRYVPLTLILTQLLIQISIIFELVGSESAKLKDAVYGLPWECMDTKNRRTVSFFLMNVQEPVHVKALGVANVGVTSMAMILKTSISYFTFLRSM